MAMNLLEKFILQRLQPTQLRIEVLRMVKDKGAQEAKVELSLTPRLVKTDSGDELPAYQVTARLSCRSGAKDKDEPLFKALVGFEAVYQQVSGDPVDIAEFTTNHPSLIRQLYPLLQQELRVLMNRVGLEQIHLPYDLAAQPNAPENATVQVSGSVH
jgi:hypothetical protein